MDTTEQNNKKSIEGGENKPIKDSLKKNSQVSDSAISS